MTGDSEVSRRLDGHHAARGLRPVSTPMALVLAMGLAIMTVVAIAYWDEQREAAAALEDFAAEQTALATSSSATLAALLAGRDAETQDASPSLVGALKAVERPGSTLLFVQPPGADDLVTTDGARIASAPVVAGLGRGDSWIRLERSEAAALGLPARVAMAGLHVATEGTHGRWGVVVVSTARRGRDREKRARWRLILGVGLASTLVVAFGGAALRRQRTQLELARELAVAEIAHERDERLLRADKLATMGALATGIAHEISTPLGVIMGRAEQLLPQLRGDDRATRALDVILAQTERIGQVIRGFLGLARGRSPSLERVAPIELARHAVELVAHRFDAAGVNLSCDADPRLPTVACEPRLFEQILVNLLLNACDACDRGGKVELSVRAEADRVAFLVVDDGVGIAAGDAARVTEPFFTTKPTGTGLGLAIASELVKHHQGTLSIRPRSADSTTASTALRGTTVCVEVPSSNEVRDE